MDEYRSVYHKVLNRPPVKFRAIDAQTHRHIDAEMDFQRACIVLLDVFRQHFFTARNLVTPIFILHILPYVKNEQDINPQNIVT